MNVTTSRLAMNSWSIQEGEPPTDCPLASPMRDVAVVIFHVEQTMAWGLAHESRHPWLLQDNYFVRFVSRTSVMCEQWLQTLQPDEQGKEISSLLSFGTS